MDRTIATWLTHTLTLTLVALAGCQGAGADTAVPPGRAGAVTVSIASATLAQDCAPSPASHATPPPGYAPPGKPGAAPRRRECRQTSVQLALASDPKAAPSALTIEKAQLFNADGGAPLQTMTIRNPTIWSDTGRYDPWDGVVKPGQKLQVSFDMNAPDWSKMGGSQYAAQGKTFRLELSVRVGGQVTRIGSVVRSAELLIEPVMPPT